MNSAKLIGRGLISVMLMAILLADYTRVQAILIPLGTDAVTRTMDYHGTAVAKDPNHLSFPIAATNQATATGNRAHSSLTAQPGEAGVIRASVGISLEWNLAGQDWEAMKDRPVDVTLNFSYQLVANWSRPNGSANAGLAIRPFQGGWYDFIGFEINEAGIRNEQVSVSFSTTPEQIGQRIYIESYAQAHTPLTRIANQAASTVVLHSIHFDFDPVPTDLLANHLEVTQAVQDLNNSVRLVAGKRTFVRFHVSNHATDKNPNSYAQLRVTQAGHSQLLAPINTGQHLTLRNEPIRGVLQHAFLFELPSEFTQPGDLTLFAELNPVTDWRKRAPTETDYTNNTLTLDVTLEDAPALNLVIYRVGYQANGRTHYPPASDVTQLVSWLQRAYPIPGVNLWQRSYFQGVGLPAPEAVNLQLLTKKRWDRLFDRGTVHGRPPVGAHFYGMVHNGGGFMRGAAVDIPGLAAAGPTGAQGFSWDKDGSFGDWYGGHELGHAYGRFHPGFCDQARDNRHPAGNHPFGRISPAMVGNSALYGFDIRTKQIYGPAWADMMTYCDYQWVSDFTYEGLLSYFQSNPVLDTGNLAHTNGTLGDYLLVNGVIDPANDQAELAPAFLLPDVVGDPLATTGTYTIVLHSASGTQLAAYPFTPRTLESGPPDPAQPNAAATNLLLMDELVPFVAGTEQLTLERAGTQLASLQPGANSPTVALTTPNGGETFTSENITVSWTAADEDGDPLYFAVQYSPDGASWEMLTQLITDNSVTISNTELIAGSAALFRIWASDGLHSASDESDASFSIPNHPPMVTILEPDPFTSPDQRTFGVSETIGFVGAVADSDELLADSQIEWHSDLDGLLGTGSQLSAVLTSSGVHTLTLQATDSANAIVSATVTITVVANPTQMPLVADQLLAAPAPLLLAPQEGISETLLAIDNQNSVNPLPWQATIDQSWLVLERAEGITPDAIVIRVAESGLAGGIYTGTITLTSSTLPEQSTIVLVSVALPELSTGKRLFLPVIRR